MSDEIIIVEVEAFLADLIPGFLENRKADVEKLTSALAGSDYGAIRHIAHDMKGLGAGYGFQLITDLGIMFSNAAKQDDEESLKQLIARYETYLSSLEIEYV